ncbi:MAG: FAD-dependent oxidoreductase [Puniceicoccaceae bacterium]|nr:MAG: FAD-dependent oxidoreductase [Puniceicoccaceae bacterium]
MTLAVKEGLLDLKTRIVIDATGDANLIALAGGPVRVHPQTQPATLNFELDGYDPSNVNFDRLDAAFREAIKRGEVQPADGSWNVETPSLRRLVGWRGRNGNHVSATADARTSRGRTQIEVEGRAAVARLLRFLNRQPGFENLRLRSVSPEAGIRETVTIKGDIEVTVDDYLSGRHWPDSICHGYYPLDLHGLTAKEGVCRMLDEGIVPTIPLGALIPHGMEGALVAGRCLSSDRLANSALRVQAICMAMGQATGAAAALAVQKQCPIRKIPLEDLRTLLTAHGAIVPE